MDIIRTVEKLDGETITIRTTTCSSETTKLDELKKFFEGRKIQLQKLEAQEEDWSKQLDECIKILSDKDETSVMVFEKKHSEMIDKLMVLGKKRNLKFQLQGCQLESEKLKADILQLQNMLADIEQRNQ